MGDDRERDTTPADRVAALERELEQTRRQLAEAQELAQIGSWEWVVATDLVTWSNEQFRIFGVKPDEFSATFEGYLACLHPDDRPLARATVERALETAADYAADYRVVCPQGEQRWVHCRGRAILADDGTVERLFGTTQDITDRRRLQAELTRRALHDPLTGLPNRSLLWDRIGHALQRTVRSGNPTVVYFIDIDGLKAVNDGAGHDVGDDALRLTARRLRGVLRENDTVARYGGDEFVVVAEGLSLPDDAIVLGGRLIAACSFAVPHESGPLSIRASVGGAVASAGSAPEAVVRDADVAMYRAKAQGGAAVEINGIDAT